MSRVAKAIEFLREATVALVAQRVFAVLTILIVAGSTFIILATAGRSAAAEEAVLGRIDAQGTRTIVVRAKGVQPGLTTAVVDRLGRLRSVESVVGFGPATDATAAALPQGSRVGVRLAYGAMAGRTLLQPGPDTSARVAWASPASSRILGLPPGRGAIRIVDGPELLIARSLTVPAYLADYEPLTVVPADLTVTHDAVPLGTVVVLVRTPQDVDAVAGAVRALLVDVPVDGATVETSSAMAELRSAVGGELTRQSRGIVLGLLGAAAAATFLNVWGMVLMRRKDFGRRRALGATRLTIVLLIVTQVLFASVVGGLTGLAAGMTWLGQRGGQQPPWSYSLSVVTALMAAGALGAAVPAGMAARRDPIRELRVP